MRRYALIGLLYGVALAGCAKKPAEGGVRMKEVDSALKEAGYKLDSFQNADPARFSAQRCVSGTLEGVDTLVCEYGSAEAVVLGKKAGEDWVGQATTGVVLDNGKTLLALADRGRADPNGKVIHKISQAYRKVR